MEIFEGVAQFKISRDELAAGIDVASLLAEKTAAFPSKGEVKKTIQGGGLSINKEKVTDITAQYTTSNLIGDQYIIVQKGKKNYFLIIVE